MSISAGRKIRVTHVITGLRTGGAEFVLYRLLSAIDREQFSCRVISLGREEPLGKLIDGLKIPVNYLGMNPGLPDPCALVRLSSWLRRDPPHVVQTWLYHADLLGGLAARLNRIPVVWGIHNSALSPGSIKKSTLWVVRMSMLLSHSIPDRIISCSQQARDVHVALGYDAKKFSVIPNGFDLNQFHPDPSARLSLCRDLGLDNSALLVGLVARFDPLKDHNNFIEAASLLHDRQPLAQFILCGDGITWDNDALTGRIDLAGLRPVFHLLGRRQDIPTIMPGLDVLVSSSFGEAFPNVLGEAMACGVPCVATDVGDSRFMIADTGRIVPPREPQILAEAVSELLDLPQAERMALGQKARQRVQELFSLPSMVQSYQDLYLNILKFQNREGE
jgi:glycosyltransferase involved in cell wall biosynthesis